MKIIIIGTAYPLRGGIAHFNALLAQQLSARHTVETITFKRQYPEFLFPGTSQEEQQSQSTDILPAPQLIDSINPLNWISVAREVRKRKPDLVIFKYWLPFFGPCFGTIAKILKKGTRTKVLYICDNVIPHERRPGDVAFTRFALRQGDFFIVQSDAVEKDLLRYFPRARYRKVPHPVYEIFGKPVSRQEARRALGISAQRIILYFGYVRAYKGLMILIEAMKKIRDGSRSSEEGNPDMELLAVGEFYDDEKQYRQRVKDLRLESCIRFVPEYVPNDRVGSYFCAADVVVLPYLSATQSGITQIAYNFNKPVIATNVGGLAEVVIDGKTGFIIPPNDPDALAGAILRFYDEKRDSEFSANVQREKLKYSWENLVENIEQLMSQAT